MNNVSGVLMTMFAAGAAAMAGEWQPKQAPLMTRWAKDVSPETVHPEYPRPQMVRAEWLNLNGLWDYAIGPKNAPRPPQSNGRILVPFPVEAALSGVMQRVAEDQRLWYRRSFTVPAKWAGKRVLLHFGAVDWEAVVWLNGKEVGTHRGGYDPFTFEITNALAKAGEQELVVAVWDPTDAGTQPRGKQVTKPGGIWYTPTTGIWQTVWLEPVPVSRIDGLRITPDVDQSCVHVAIDERAIAQVFHGSHVLEVAVLDQGREVAGATSAPDHRKLRVDIPSAKLWSPEDPFLYDLRLRLVWKDGGERRVIDEVASYFGMRKISLGKDARGITRLMLNNEPYFMFGPLDQGFCPDGLYAAPTDEALRYDLEMTKKLGFNLVRKHVKIEPDRWYYWCDRLGLLVWQDMPSGDAYIGPNDPDSDRSPESARQFELELRRLIEDFYNHPSIVTWVIFNEGWGQYDTARLVDYVRELDATRLVNSASGWTDRGVGDVHDIHSYPGPAAPASEPNRAAVLGEFGGLGLPVPGHTWLAEKSWGYRSFESSDELTAAYLKLLETLWPMIADPGLSAAVYTQTTDVEIEVNGLLTYDRTLVKMDVERVAAANRALRGAAPTSQPASER